MNFGGFIVGVELPRDLLSKLKRAAVVTFISVPYQHNFQVRDERFTYRYLFFTYLVFAASRAQISLVNVTCKSRSDSQLLFYFLPPNNRPIS